MHRNESGSRCHHDHHACFMRIATLSNATMLSVISSQTARGSAGMGSRWIAHDKPQDRINDKGPGAESSTSEPKGQELVYAARISLDRTQMQVDENLVNLSPGMAVTVEIKTGARRIITYLLSPLLRYGHDSLHER